MVLSHSYTFVFNFVGYLFIHLLLLFLFFLKERVEKYLKNTPIQIVFWGKSNHKIWFKETYIFDPEEILDYQAVSFCI